MVHEASTPLASDPVSSLAAALALRPRAWGTFSTLAVAASLALFGACTPEGFGDASSATETSGSATGDGSGGSSDDEETTTEGSTGEGLVCEPGAARCSEDGLAAEICADDGLGYGVEVCSAEESCVQGACLGPCDLVKDEPSSAGCAFTTQASAHNDKEPDGLMVTNISDVPTSVQLLAMPKGTHDEEAVGDAVILAAGEGHLFEIPGQAVLQYSAYFTGGSFRVVSDHPVVVHQQAPLDSPWSSDSGLLLPDHALGLEYIIASYPAAHEPSYFTVVALEDKTHLSWTPPADSAGSGLPIPFVAAGETGELTMLRGDTVRIGASALTQEDPLLRDLSGTLVWADKPIAVVGSSRCAQVPVGEPHCDHLYEPMLPVQAWGQHYIGAPAPSWQEGAGRWRIYAGADGVTVEVETGDEQPPVLLAQRGDWVELDVGGAAVSFTGDGPFLPVYYLQSAGEAGGLGDPSMVQAAPVEQYLARYAFSTGVDAQAHVVQVTRRVGAAPVMLDDAIIDSFEIAVGGYEIAEVSVEAGAHVASSEEAFGLQSLGYGEGSSYAHLAGVGLAALAE